MPYVEWDYERMQDELRCRDARQLTAGLRGAITGCCTLKDLQTSNSAPRAAGSRHAASDSQDAAAVYNNETADTSRADKTYTVQRNDSPLTTHHNYKQLPTAAAKLVKIPTLSAHKHEAAARGYCWCKTLAQVRGTDGQSKNEGEPTRRSHSRRAQHACAKHTRGRRVRTRLGRASCAGSSWQAIKG